MVTQIYTWEDLNNIRNNLSEDYILMNDLGPSDTGYDTYASSSANSGAGWLPIGDPSFSPSGNSNSFEGTFNGQGYSISGIYINRTSSYNGLFQAMVRDCLIENLNVLDVNITSGNSAGAIVGYIFGAYKSGDGCIIRNCISSGTIKGYTANQEGFGGIAGSSNYFLVEKCSSSCVIGDLSFYTSYSGGIIGRPFTGLVQNCYFNGWVKRSRFAGGITGGVTTVNNCYCSGTVNEANYFSPNYTGGITSVFGYDFQNPSVTNSYYDEAKVYNYFNSPGNSGTPVNDAELKFAGTYNGWNILSTTYEYNNGYPYLSFEIGESDTVWKIPFPITTYQLDKYAKGYIRLIPTLIIHSERIDQ